MKAHSKHYDRLTGAERFRLCLAALARDDTAEAAALGDSCPTFHYTMRDWSFGRRNEASLQLMMTLALELAPHLAILRELDWQAKHLGGALEQLQLSGFNAAIEAHWRAVDPEGTPETRLHTGLAMPDLTALMTGNAGASFRLASALMELHGERLDKAAQAVANILAGFDQFAREHWGLPGPEAIAAHSELFEDLSAMPDATLQAEAVEETKLHIAGRFTLLWKTLVAEH